MDIWFLYGIGIGIGFWASIAEYRIQVALHRCDWLKFHIEELERIQKHHSELLRYPGK